MSFLLPNKGVEVDRFSIGIPITKVDAEKRIVYGEATREVVDKDDMIITYEASKKAFKDPAWPGNIREQHSHVAAGKAVSIDFNDDSKSVMVASYISKGAEPTWQKILDGTLAYYSIGGRVTEAKGEVRDGKDVYVVSEYRLVELSLVDNPGCPVGKFTIMNADGLAPDVLARDELVKELMALTWDSPAAATITEEVIKNMSKKDVIKDEAVEAVEPVEPDAPETPEETPDETPEVVEQADKPEDKPKDDEPKVQVDEVKQAADTLARATEALDAATEALKMATDEFMVAKKDTVDEPETPDAPVIKDDEAPDDEAPNTVEDMVKSLNKQVEDLKGQIAKLADTPAPVKAKSTYTVTKAEDETPTEKADRVEVITDELKKLSDIMETDPDRYKRENLAVKAFNLINERNAINKGV